MPEKLMSDTARMALCGAILIAPTNIITPSGSIIRIPTEKYIWVQLWRQFSRHPPMGTHAPQSIIYGTHEGKHLKGDTSIEVEI